MVKHSLSTTAKSTIVLAALFLLLGCATSPPKTAKQSFEECMSDVSSSSDFSPLRPHIPFQVTSATSDQLSDASIATKEEVDALKRIIPKWKKCRETFIQNDRTSASLLVLINDELNAVILDLVNQKISWGVYTTRRKEMYDVASEQIAASIKANNEAAAQAKEEQRQLDDKREKEWWDLHHLKMMEKVRQMEIVGEEYQNTAEYQKTVEKQKAAEKQKAVEQAQDRQIKQSLEDKDHNVCLSYGLKKGSSDYVNCRLKLREQQLNKEQNDSIRTAQKDQITHEQQQADLARQQSLAQLRHQEERARSDAKQKIYMDMLATGLSMMAAPPPPTISTTHCNVMGNMVNCTEISR